MAKQRYINTKFWSDSFIVKLDPLARYLFLYFLTNEHTDICGIYELSEDVMGRETGLDGEMIKKIIDNSLSQSGTVCYIDEWICIKNFIKHQRINDSVKRGVARSLGAIPPHIWAKIKEKDTVWYSLLQSATDSPQTVPRLSDTYRDNLYTNSPTVNRDKGGVVETPPDGEVATTNTDLDMEGFLPREAIKKLYDSTKLHERIIGLFLDHRNFVARNQKHFSIEFRKHLKAASDLASLDYGPDFYSELFVYTDAELKKGNNALASVAVNLSTTLKYVEKFRTEQNIA